MKFKELSISDKTLEALTMLGYTDATEVQEKAIPLVLQGEEVLVRSQTGTGKTAAFGIALVEILSKEPNRKALILAPTRELAVQITKELRGIAKTHRMRIYAIYGGQDMRPQIQLIKGGYDILVATPGRLLDHVRQKVLDLSVIGYAVLDEADRMLDMGFKEDVDNILSQINHQRQILLFSATIDARIKEIASTYMNSPEVIEIGEHGKAESIEEEFINLPRKDKMQKLIDIITKETDCKIIVFASTKHAVEFVCRKLNIAGIKARYLHGGKSQNQRERTLKDFQDGFFNILVATDVAARGLHIEEVSHIINYDRAQSHDTHTHRIGRTGRMGKKGKAITFVETDYTPRQVDYSKPRLQGSDLDRPRRISFSRRPERGGSRFGRGQSREGGDGYRGGSGGYGSREGGFRRGGGYRSEGGPRREGSSEHRESGEQRTEGGQGDRRPERRRYPKHTGSRFYSRNTR